ncbi:MAG TPA: kelch repeat-containing protein, partial [Terracidiphilus sp.]|nr:kelch repeat-containing protein [Terracidiphilus sp.]
MMAGAIAAPAQAPTLLPDWTQQSPIASPPVRYIHAMTYDGADGQTVLFGGFGENGFLNDTWTWNGTTWTNVTPANAADSPAVRGAHAMVYDATHNQVVMFGGFNSTSQRLGDTWVWNGTIWTNVTPASPANSPSARDAAVMVYDAAQGNVVLFGGSTLGSPSAVGDTWVWNGTTWTNVTPASAANSPSARSDYSMVYDAALGQVVLFGGEDASGNYLNDTWTWNGTTWTQANSAGPSARYAQGMAYDPVLGEVVMWGGENSNGYLNDTWVWNGTTWTEQSSSPTALFARSIPNGMTYAVAQDQVILFGGFSMDGQATTVFGDTWEWSPPQNFGSVNVCPSGQTTPAPCSETVSLTYGVSVDTNFGTPQILTQGAAGLDFHFPTPGNNTCSGTVTAGSTCVFNVTFAPLAPGLRTGAVELFNNVGGLLTTTPIYGVGQGALTAFTPFSTTVKNTGPLTGPKGVLVDAAGDLFVSDYEGHKVVEVGPNTSNQVVTVAQSPQVSLPQGLAMDGAGNLYVADTGIPGVVKIPWGCTSSICQQTVPNPLGLTGQFGVSVDSQGDLFVSSYNSNEVVEVPVNGGAQTVVYSGTTPIGTAVDATGDLFVADAGGQAFVKVPAGCTNSGCYVTIGSNWSSPESVALDAAGDLYMVDGGQHQEVVEFPVGCTSNACQITIANTSLPSLGSSFAPYDAVTDGHGNVYIADWGNKRVDEVPQSQPPSLSFGATNVGLTSADSPQSLTIQNIGNQDLSAVSPGLSFTDPDFYQVSGSGTPADCTSAFSLAPGATCNLSVDFGPLSNGSLSGSAVFTDNALNANPNAAQTVTFSGSGTGGISYTLTVTDSGAGSGS